MTAIEALFLVMSEVLMHEQRQRVLPPAWPGGALRGFPGGCRGLTRLGALHRLPGLSLTCGCDSVGAWRTIRRALIRSSSHKR
jgi:hypothetical protein